MASRDRITNPDSLAALQERMSVAAGVTVRALTSDLETIIQLWQIGPETPAGGVCVASRAWPRKSQDPVDILQVAALLARTVSALDREGWPGLR